MERHKTRNLNIRNLSTELLPINRTLNYPTTLNRLKVDHNITIEVPDSSTEFINTKAHYLSQSRDLVRKD